MALRPPVPTWGKSGEASYGYQINGGATAGSSFSPVLFLDSFTGFAAS